MVSTSSSSSSSRSSSGARHEMAAADSGITIGVLALQGDFQAHRRAVERAGAAAIEVRAEDDLLNIDGLIIPGGESTTMLKLLHIEKLFEPLQQFGQRNPVFGTCAGAILLASEVLHPRQESLGLMDLTVERNAYGRQIDSRIAQLEIGGKTAEAVFIRAPIIRKVGPETKVLASYLGNPVLVEQRFHLVSTFHPELSRKNEIHQHFVNNVIRWKNTWRASRRNSRTLTSSDEQQRTREA